MWRPLVSRSLDPARNGVCGCFFFQAEDGIRDWSVTGVQTCALPIWASSRVFVEVLVERPAGPDLGPTLRLIVDDDGRGLSSAERAQVSRRGQRLDEDRKSVV